MIVSYKDKYYQYHTVLRGMYPKAEDLMPPNEWEGLFVAFDKDSYYKKPKGFEKNNFKTMDMQYGFTGYACQYSYMNDYNGNYIPGSMTGITCYPEYGWVWGNGNGGNGSEGGYSGYTGTGGGTESNTGNGTGYSGSGGGTVAADVTNNLNYPPADCIYKNLVSNTTFQDYIRNFKNSTTLNLTFQMGYPVNKDGNPVNGQTSHILGTTNFTITIDWNYFGLYGGIEVAKTFLHEAFHANLYTQALLWYPADLPNNFQNWSIVEQIKYVDNRSGSIAGFSNSHQHNYMATQIDQIAYAIKAYTLAHYPTIYNNPNATIDSYRAMAYKGLEGTQCYTTYINSLPNGQTSFINAYGELIRTVGENKCPL